jgi:hypothetical protein
MSRDRAHRTGARTGALGVAAGGVLVGHWLTYRLLVPGDAPRQALLSATGHAYLGLANAAGLALGLVALAAVFLDRITNRDTEPATLRALAVRLATFQVCAFAAMELIERLTSGAPASGALHDGLLPVGMAVQVAIALIGALAVRWLLLTASRVNAVAATLPRLPRAVARIAAVDLRLVPSPACAPPGIRAPPVSA